MKSELSQRHVNENEWVWTILGLAIFFGSFVRFLPGPLAGFPINDGGMFAVMMRDLRANNFALPVFTTYNYSEIPFAYPPLGLYLGALFEQIGLSEVQVLIWLPAFLTVATISVFYLLALALLENRPRAAVATIFFALAPGNYVWYLMGGGLTRALGAVLFILSLYFVYRTFKESSWRLAIYSTLSCALTILSHPQAALLLVMGCAVFWLFHGLSRSSSVKAFVIAFGAFVLTSPWWGVVISYHGLDVFFSAVQSGNLSISISALFNSLIMRQTIIPFSTLFWCLGLLWAIYMRRFDILLWGFLPYFIDQRSSPIAASLLYPMLAAYGFMDVLPGIIYWVRNKKWAIREDDFLFNWHGFSMSMLGLAFYLFIECFFHIQVINSVNLNDEARDMMLWVNKNTPANSEFIILTGRHDPMTDPVQEWFPALAERHSATTLQGLEWTLKEGFNNHSDQLTAFQNCREIDCVDSWVNKMGLQYTFIVVDESIIPADIFISQGYELLFDNGRYIVLQ